MERLTVDPIAQEAVILADTSYWATLDEVFLDYGKKRDAKKLANKLESTLSYLLRREFHVIISNTNRKDPFFGMYVFPSEEWISSVVKKIVVDGVKFPEVYRAWAKISSWVIEIDAQLFDQYSLALNPRELSALVLHEIGHVMQSDETPERFYRLYQGYSIAKRIQRDPAVKALYMLYMIPLSVSCMSKICVRPDIHSRNIEVKADKFVIIAGYGEDLLTAMNKIIRAYGTATISESSEQEAEQKVEESINWATLNAQSFVYRKNHLKDDLYLRTKKSHSVYMASIAQNISYSLGIKLKERYTGNTVDMAMEHFLSDREELFPACEMFYDMVTRSQIISDMNNIERRIASAAMEGFGKKKVPEMPSQFDLDSIAIEIDRMENQHDRMYVLDLIYYQIDRLDKMDEYIAGDLGLEAKYKSKIEKYRVSLETMRQAVLNKHNFGKEYKLWVKYPEGYEG